MRCGAAFRLLTLGGLLLVGLPAFPVTAQTPSPEGTVTPDGAAAKTAEPLDFERVIRPIFKARCYECHAADEQESGLRLDRKRAALEGGDSGVSIVPGKSEKSRLYRYIAGLDDDVVMPPEDEARLDKKQIAAIRIWIDQGAAWPDDGHDESADKIKSDHWAFQPVAHEDPPKVKNESWVRNSIDAFVLAKLESLGIAPSPEARRAMLIRRLYLDLTGLPPAAGEVEAFELDNRPDAYERVVDRLLASPHYGERWARHWLDVARYSDSDGYEKDRPRPFAWRWRDWVINALNRDMPFDQFTVEQLAGDLLPQATIEQKIATGFHRNTLTNREGGIDPEEDRFKQNIDRTNTTGSVWLAMTIGCCQCHSHKYDPLSQRDFYRFLAFFNDADEADISAPLAAEVAAYKKAQKAFDDEHRKLTQAVAQYEQTQLSSRFAEWEPRTQKPATVWTVLNPIEVRSAGGATFERLDDGSLLVTGENPAEDTYTLVFQTDLPGITAIRLDALADDRLPAKGPGRVKHGNFVLGELSLTAAPGDAPKSAQRVAFTSATADFSQDAWNVAAAIDGKSKTGWGIGPRYGENHAAVFQTKQPIGGNGTTRLVLTLEQAYGSQHTLGRFRILAAIAAPPVRFVSDDVAFALATDPAHRSDQQRRQLKDYYPTVDQPLVDLRRAVAEHQKQAPKHPDSKAQTFAARSDPRVTHMHIRGDFLQLGAEVQAATPAVLPPLHPRGKRADRLDLARWIVDPANPLTARVTVNRVWQRYFGLGLVATEDDFGSQGERPSHPGLLDWLASEFVRRDWSLKQLHKLIVMSATYRQSSAARPELAAQDPNNRLLARQSRFRVEAEIIRDLALSVSGLLDVEIGGRSIRPPMPEGVASLGYADSVKWTESKGAEKYRRGMYIFNQRTVPYPMLTAFDAPDSSILCTRRERSNTPLQALTVLNDPVFFECAQHLGHRLASALPESPLKEQIQYAFRCCLSRPPSAEEAERLQTLYQELLTLCRKHPDSAAQLAGEQALGKEQTSGKLDTAQVAAWVALGRALINLDEFATRE